jgi:triosephosphate isomerase
MDAGIAKQVVAALDAELIPILCIGETKEEREKGETKERLQQQLSILLSGNSQFSILNSQFILAYEPVWAISGGNGSSEAMAAKESQEMHSYIRSLLPDSLKKTRILYGGSMNAKNAKEILSEPDIDGGLIGNASLHPEEFGRIVEISREI